MKIHGKTIKGPNIEIIVIPRSTGDIIFKAQAVLSFDDFTRLCPVPKPPMMYKRGEGKVPDTNDKIYKAAIDGYADKRIDWLVITSLAATEGLEWDQVKLDDPSTWHLFKKELQDSGFGQYEINRIINGCMIANCLDESKVQQARERFLAGQGEEPDKSSSLNGEQKSTPSGEPVNVST